MRVRERTTAELLLLMLGITVCLILLFTGAAITVIVLLNPTYPIGDLTRAYIVALQNVLFAILGVAAGRSFIIPSGGGTSEPEHPDAPSEIKRPKPEESSGV